MTSHPYEYWMQNIAQEILDKRLCDLCIPGTHNSGARNLQETQTAGHLGANWANNQSFDIEAQLLAGIRAFDLRLLYTGNTEDPVPKISDVLITHSSDGTYPSLLTFKGQAVEAIFDAMARFIATHVWEILIVRIHKTYRFNDRVHKLVAEKLRQLFESKAISRKESGRKLRDHFASWRRIVVAYDTLPDAMVDQYPRFWKYGVDSSYGDTMSIADLFRSSNSFLSTHARERESRRGDPKYDPVLYDLRFCLTVNGDGIVKEMFARPELAFIALGVFALIIAPIAAAAHRTTLFTSNRQMALLTNMTIQYWTRILWANKLNIVSLDYFDEGGDLLALVKDINCGKLSIPAAGSIVKDGDEIRLRSMWMRHIGPSEKKFTASAGTWEYQPTVVDGHGASLKIVKVMKDLVRDSTIRHFDYVYIVTQEGSVVSDGIAYDHLGAWKTEHLYYYKRDPKSQSDEEHKRMTWIILKLSTSDKDDEYVSKVYHDPLYRFTHPQEGGEIRAEEPVMLVNVHYGAQVLVPTADGWLTTRELVAEPHFWWIEK
jgi:hypothetical protein